MCGGVAAAAAAAAAVAAEETHKHTELIDVHIRSASCTLGTSRCYLQDDLLQTSYNGPTSGGAGNGKIDGRRERGAPDTSGRSAL